MQLSLPLLPPPAPPVGIFADLGRWMLGDLDTPPVRPSCALCARLSATGCGRDPGSDLGWRARAWLERPVERCPGFEP
jgi:hypothetical protein